MRSSSWPRRHMLGCSSDRCRAHVMSPTAWSSCAPCHKATRRCPQWPSRPRRPRSPAAAFGRPTGGRPRPSWAPGAHRGSWQPPTPPPGRLRSEFLVSGSPREARMTCSSPRFRSCGNATAARQATRCGPKQAKPPNPLSSAVRPQIRTETSSLTVPPGSRSRSSSSFGSTDSRGLIMKQALLSGVSNGVTSCESRHV